MMFLMGSAEADRALAFDLFWLTIAGIGVVGITVTLTRAYQAWAQNNKIRNIWR